MVVIFESGVGIFIKIFIHALNPAEPNALSSEKKRQSFLGKRQSQEELPVGHYEPSLAAPLHKVEK
jgi:hypothetical protein